MSAKNLTAAVLLLFVAASIVWMVVKPAGEAEQVLSDGVVVYYLHRTERCATCETIEKGAQEAVTSGFQEELDAESLQWRIVNYELKGNEALKKRYKLDAPMVVLSARKGGKEQDSKQLVRVWGFATSGDKQGLIDYVRQETEAFLASQDAESPESTPTEDDPPSSSSDPDSESIEVDEEDGEAPLPL